MAHFYNNRGAERPPTATSAARAFFDASLGQDSGFAPVWNNLGVLAHREGNTEAARQALDRSLQLDGRQDAALTNASALFRSLGLTAQAQSSAG